MNMKRYRNKMAVLLALVLPVGGGMLATSCSDDIPSESYYTFTGEMMSDYLNSRSNFSGFAQIVTKAGLMDQLSAYGEYTCFAPTNEAVNAYMTKKGYSSVAEIPVEVCDTIARTHLVDKLYHTVDMTGNSLGSLNMLGRTLLTSPGYVTELQEDGSVDTLASTILVNKTALIIPELMNDSVENGIVQPVNAIIEPSKGTLTNIMQDNPKISLFYDALVATGLIDSISKIEDLSWDPAKYPNFYPDGKIIKSNGHDNRCYVPERRKYGFTAFVVPDSILRASKGEGGYEINSLKDFYDYAVSVYPADMDLPYNQFTEEALTDRRNPLNKLIAYHLLDRLGLYDRLTTNSTIKTTLANPTEWYSTMCPHTTMKIEKATVLRYVALENRNKLYINRAMNDRGGNIEGSMITPTIEDEYEQMGENCIYYYIDKLVDYGTETKEVVFNTRMRMDLYTLFPELMSNNIRTDYNTLPESENTTGRYAKNYVFPQGYLDNVNIVGDGYFIYQFCHNYYWSYEGDEFNLKGEQSDSYDITFKLPSVPEGTYEIRLGFAATSTRGIAQVYFDGEARGIPLDMRKTGTDPSIGWKNPTQLSADEDTENKKELKNNGYYRGPRSVFNFSTSGIPDGSINTENYFYNNAVTIRKVLCTVTLDDPNRDHTLRIRSVYAEGGAELMIDYIEIVPKSVYGIEGEGKGEDDY